MKYMSPDLLANPSLLFLFVCCCQSHEPVTVVILRFIYISVITVTTDVKISSGLVFRQRKRFYNFITVFFPENIHKLVPEMSPASSCQQMNGKQPFVKLQLFSKHISQKPNQ